MRACEQLQIALYHYRVVFVYMAQTMLLASKCPQIRGIDSLHLIGVEGSKLLRKLLFKTPNLDPVKVLVDIPQVYCNAQS